MRSRHRRTPRRRPISTISTTHDGSTVTAAHAGHDKHAGHDPEAFRRRFWLTLLLTIPVVASSEMVMEWFGYELDGVGWVGPVLGTFIFVWGGQPFLAGAVAEVRDRQPGMMLLISMAITVAWVASMSTSRRLVRPRVLVGAGAARDDHAARALAGDEGDRSGARRAGGAGRAPARRSRAGHGRRCDRAGPDRRPGGGRPGAGPIRRAGPGRRSRSSRARPSSTSR